MNNTEPAQKTFVLTVFWKSHSITVSKEYPNWTTARSWAGICLENCGRDVNGNHYTGYHLHQR